MYRSEPPEMLSNREREWDMPVGRTASPSAINNGIENLAASLSALEKLLHALEERITPVLGEPIPIPDQINGANKPVRGSCTISRQITEVTNHIDSLRAYTDSLISRCEL